MTDETLASRKTKDEPNEDITLATAAPEPDDEPDIEEVTGALDAEDFDFGAFVDGSRSTRHAVRPAMRGDLLEVMDTIVMQVEDAEKAGADTAELMEQYEQVKAEFEASKRLIVVEARSSAWMRKRTKQAEREGLVAPGKKAPADVQQEYGQALLLRQLAGQIVHPVTGVTVEALTRLLEVNEPAVDLIWAAARRANSNPAAVRPDFSRPR